MFCSYGGKEGMLEGLKALFSMICLGLKGGGGCNFNFKIPRTCPICRTYVRMSMLFSVYLIN
jgi:hypothetical protein